ncbi:tRNA lysidine(34) synthetase TilS [Micrococcus sp.]|uniref:tRNA lysidine(34) synthetase TilS n=1 Tax=Micrococcus sp. TaxID=1271 RepID=UPI002A90DC5E|nr:tRNA lysidine(34) synthetase TilS [Micrococcus sp.]MDY6054659.1 tRNA lysidine(34) synthetase TilS [Micrococcus sp.]
MRWPEPLHRAVTALGTTLSAPESSATAAPATPAPATPRALVALSGGADSLALATACAVLTRTRAGEQLGPVGAVVVDHGLQPGSDAVAQAAARTARRLGLAPVHLTRVHVSPTGDGPEAAARTARREALARAALTHTPQPLVLTAHTADDQAEQVLLGLARGSGTRSLAGIPAHGTLPHRVDLARPLLGLTRQDTEAICRWAGLAWFTDPHNADPALLRSRLRTRVLPALEDPDAGLGPGLRAGLVRTAALAAEDAEALDGWARQEADRLGVPAGPGERALDLTALAALPAAVRRRVLALTVRAAGGAAPTRERLLAVDALVTGAHIGGSAGPVQLPGPLEAWRTRVPGERAEGADVVSAAVPCARLVVLFRRPAP